MQLCNWRLTYGNWKDGMSINTLFRHCEAEEHPCLIIIQEFNKSILGAYLSDPIRTGFNFYGTGETFVFTLKNIKDPKCYRATGANQDFIYADHTGIAVGCDPKYGIFIHEDLTKGYTSKCASFDNEILSQEAELDIEFLEIWTLEL